MERIEQGRKKEGTDHRRVSRVSGLGRKYEGENKVWSWVRRRNEMLSLPTPPKRKKKTEKCIQKQLALR